MSGETAAQIVAYKARSMFAGDNWCAKCERCGAVLTKYCDTEDQALREAASEPHPCTAQPSSHDGGGE